MKAFWEKQTRVQRISLAVGASFFLYIFLSSLLSSSGSKVITQTSEPEGEAQSELVLQEFSRVMLRKGKKSLEVRAKTGRYLPQERVTYLSDAVVKVQRENGEPVTIRSRNARLFMEGEQVKQADLEGDVQVEFGSGTTLRTNLASFDSEVIRAPGSAEIEGRGFKMEGDGMEAEVEREVVRLLREVRSRFEKGASLPNIQERH